MDNFLIFLKEYAYITSYVGLFLSLFIYRKSYSIGKELLSFKNSLVFKKRLPKILINMDDNLKQFTTLLNMPYNEQNMKLHLNSYKNILRGFKNKNLNNELNKEIDKAKNSIDSFIEKSATNNEAFKIRLILNDIYNNLTSLKLEEEELQ